MYAAARRTPPQAAPQGLPGQPWFEEALMLTDFGVGSFNEVIDLPYPIFRRCVAAAGALTRRRRSAATVDFAMAFAGGEHLEKHLQGLLKSAQ